MESSNDLISLEDELAIVLGQFSLALGFARIRRCMWLFSWPCLMVKVLAQEERDATVALFQSDERIFEDYKRMKGKRAVDEAIIKRHVMHLVVCQQYAVGLRLSHSQATQEFLEVVSSHFRGIISTQGVEDMIGIMKKRFRSQGHLEISKASTRNGQGCHQQPGGCAGQV